jgi:hypothetical protein
MATPTTGVIGAGAVIGGMVAAGCMVVRMDFMEGRTADPMEFTAARMAVAMEVVEEATAVAGIISRKESAMHYTGTAALLRL